MYVGDTIAAIATPPGVGAIGIVRASGPDVLHVAHTVLRRARAAGPAGGVGDADRWRSHKLYRVSVMGSDGSTLDDAVAVLMRGPHSYTGEDVLEIHCHGSPVVLRLTLEAVLAAGARAAEPGEFTRRAFLNGKLDLAQAESVVDLVNARTAAGAAQASEQLAGRLSAHLDTLRHEVTRIKAHVEVKIEFADEDIDLADDEAIGSLRAVIASMDSLLAGYARARLTRLGLRVALVGPPNVGKSSLLNALLGEDRAIVTPIPGTTRDLIEETADFGGVPVVLTDTAGLRESADPIEGIGVERARQSARKADVVLHVFDSSLPPPPCPAQLMFDVEHRIVVLNKSDLPSRWTTADLAKLGTHRAAVRTSALTGEGLDALRSAVIEAMSPSVPDAGPVLSRSRQRDAVAKARQCLAHALEGLERGVPADLVAVDLQAALDHLGSVTGLITSDDVLDAIFAEFCIGK